MLLHPGIISLIVGDGIVLLLVFSASMSGIRIIQRWDITSSSEEQLIYERKTYLISSLAQYALAFETISLFLFIYAAEDIHPLLAGAMCATGSLNANPYGFPALYAKIAAFFASAAWITINKTDNKAEDYPLVKIKYRLLPVVFLMLVAGFILQLQYFLKIKPDVITSCCGAAFSEKGEGIASSLAAFQVIPAKILFCSILAVLISTATAVYKTQQKPFAYILSIFSFMFFIVSVIAIISFISPYFYQLPSHHCPFDILQREYYYVGYLLYASLFIGSFFGMITGIAEPFKKIPSLTKLILKAQKKWSLHTIIWLIIFALTASAPMILVSLKL